MPPMQASDHSTRVGANPRGQTSSPLLEPFGVRLSDWLLSGGGRRAGYGGVYPSRRHGLRASLGAMPTVGGADVTSGGTMAETPPSGASFSGAWKRRGHRSSSAAGIPCASPAAKVTQAAGRRPRAYIRRTKKKVSATTHATETPPETRMTRARASNPKAP